MIFQISKIKSVDLIYSRKILVDIIYATPVEKVITFHGIVFLLLSFIFFFLTKNTIHRNAYSYYEPSELNKSENVK